MRLYWQNLSDDESTVVTASSESAELPPSNVQHPFIGRVFRSGAVAGAQTLTIALPSAQAVQAFIAAGHTLPGTANARLQATLDDAGFAGVNLLVDEPIDYTAKTLGVELVAPVTARYWRLTWTQAAAVDIGRVYLGPITVLDDEPDQSGYDRKYIDLSRSQRSQSGQEFSEIRPRIAAHSFRYSYVDQTFVDDLDEVAAAVGTHTPLFFWVPAVTAAPVYAKLTEHPAPKASAAGAGILYDLDVRFEEQVAAYAAP